MTRVFRNRAEAEAAGLKIFGVTHAVDKSGNIVARVRTDLEAQLAEALEAAEWDIFSKCPLCLGVDPNVLTEESDDSEEGHRADCKLSLALKAFRGEAL